MKHLRLTAALIVAIHLPFSTALGQAPQAPAPVTKLQLASSSEAAKAAFWSALDDANNIFPERARIHAAKAVSLDPSFGLARALAAFLAGPATGVTPEQRMQEFDRGVADAARASARELIVAMSLRANALGPVSDALVIATAAAALMPDEPVLALNRVLRMPAAERLTPMLELTRKFPSYAPPYRAVAFAQLAAGDTAAALQTITGYVRQAPNHPGTHDSYAQLLQVSGRYADAIGHYERAMQLDSTFSQGYAGIAESHLFSKKYAEAIPQMQRTLAMDPTYAPGYTLIAQAQLALGQPEQARSTFTVAATKAINPLQRFIASANAALMSVPAGKPKEAVAELLTLAAGAEQQNLGPQAAGTHRNVAMLEAAFGDKKAVAGHLAKAAALTPAPAPTMPPAFGAGVFRAQAVAYALSGQLDLARSSAAEFTKAAANGAAVQQANGRELNAIIAVLEKDLDKAKAELALAGPAATLGKAMLAAALRSSGKRAEASAMKAEILGATPAITVFDVIARARALKL